MWSQPTRVRFVERRAAPDSAALVPVDAEGDGVHDFALARGRHLTLAREVEGDLRAAWQHNFDTSIRPPLALDLDGDGREELVVSMLRDGRGEITVLDGDERPVERFGPIGPPPGPDRTWEGLMAPAAVARTPQGRALLCLQLTTYSGHARTLMSFPRGARGPAWRATLGPWPAQTLATDLDGDGLDEVLIGADSPDNGVSAGGTDDSRAWALAFGGDGRARWARPLAGAFAQVRVLPLPGPAPRTVLASVHSHHAREAGGGQVLLLDGATGEVRTRRDFRWQPGWPRLLDTLGPRIVLGASDGTLRILDGALEIRAERDLGEPCEAWLCADLDGRGPASVIATTPTRLLALDGRLRIRGEWRIDPRTVDPPAPALARAEGGRALIVLSNQRPHVIEAVPVPVTADLPGLGTVLALGGLAGLAAGVLGRPRRRAAGVDAVHGFLLDYHQIHHETFEQTRPFARLRLWAQAEAAGRPLPAEMLESACAEYLGIGAHALRRFAARARSLSVPNSMVQRIERLVEAVEASLLNAQVAPATERRMWVDRALHDMDLLAEAGFGAYREVALRDPCMPSAEIEAAVRSMAGAPGLEGVHIETRDETEARPLAMMDRGELRALVAELIANAGRALAGAAAPEIAIVVADHPSDPRLVRIEITDNGPGVPESRREAVFAPGGSTRPGGGFGLARARETARRWLGELALDAAPSGHGTRVTLTLRALALHPGGEPARSKPM